MANTFKLPIFACDLGEIDCIFGLDAGKKLVSLHVHDQAGFGSTQINTMNQNNCLGIVAILSANFEQFKEFNLNRSRLQLLK